LRDASSLPEILAMSSTAVRNAASFAFEGFAKPLIFLTNCTEAARISSSVTGGSKLCSVLMFLHIDLISVPAFAKAVTKPVRRDDEKHLVGGLAVLINSEVRVLFRQAV